MTDVRAGLSDPSRAEEAPPDGALARLEREVEHASLFTHTALGRSFARLGEVEAFVYGLIDTLVTQEVVSAEDVAQAAGNVREEMVEEDGIGVGVALRIDAPTETGNPPVAVDCAARMHVCHAVCCKLHFALSAEEVEAGRVKWDLGRPYFIRHVTGGFCVHNDRASGRCGVYEDRPSLCRTYSCATDGRIWKDFDAVELNVEWLTEHLTGEQRPHLAAAFLMQGENQAEKKGEASDLSTPIHDERRSRGSM